ncbi:Ig-like domain-containing protein [uncultured Methanosphaera sp.]|uniref:beta strand repeat-containing protein n=1 Tax=uncultured Methanosphaera sp. TaxID=262501 RepID=UPI00259776C9|nr:Ig-like domain-containing protein [uncultured Methanosphaera sp.]
MIKQKSFIFVMTLMVLLIGLTAISAADTSNTTVTSDVATPTVNTHTSDLNKIASDNSDVKSLKTETKIVKKIDNTKIINEKSKETKTIKTTSTNTQVNINNTNFDDYFSNEGFIGGIDNGYTLNFITDVSRNNKTYVLDKQVTINGAAHTLTLNTTSGSYYGNETGGAFIIDHGASGTQLSNLNFYNTQVFVRNTTNVTVSNVNVTVENQRIGQGVGVFSIRDNASYVTVENSNFKTTNNNGSSTLVLAWANNCTLINNTITGTGDVGNLIYLTTYNVQGQSYTDITLNRGNRIINNTVRGPVNSGLCYGITLSGGDNFVENNTIYYQGQGITTQWMSTSSIDWTIGDNYDRYTGNTYKNNKLYNGSSFTASLNSTIENNTCSGTVISGVNSTLKNNAFTGVVTLQSGSNATENTITTLKALGNNTIIGNNITLLNITGSNVAMINNTGDSLYVISGLTNITSCNDDFQDRETLSNITPCNHTHDTNIRKSKSLKREDIEWYEITITKDNYLTYLRESGTLPFSTVKNHPYIRIYIEDLPTSQFGMGIAGKACKGYVYEIIGKNFTKNNFQLNIGNSIDSNITIANMTLTYDESYADPANMIVLKTMYSNVLLENITINATFEDSVDSNICPIKSTFYDGNNITINNCNITLKSTEFNNPVEYTISAIDLEKNNNTVSNCNINASVPSNMIDWDKTNHPASMVIYSRSTNTTLKNNNITITESQALDNRFNTLYGILLASNNTVVNNTINITGTEYLYSIQVRGSNNNISNNNINLTSRNYLSGIMIEGVGMSNNTIANNNIIFNGGNRSSDPSTGAEDSVYGISIQNFGYGGYDYIPGSGNVTNNKVINNTITGTGYNVYAFEQFGGDNTTVVNNTINLTAHTPMAIGIIGAYSNVTGNNIIVDGADNATYPSADYLKPRTTGIYFAYGQENNAINNTINSRNNAGIIIDGGETSDIIRYNTVKSLNNTYAVTVTGNNHQVTDNSLVAKELSGDNSVLATGENNTIKDNTGKNIEYVNINVDSAIIGTVNTPIAVVVNVTTTDGSKVGEGFVRLTDNKGNIIAGATVVDGSATIYTTFTTARARNIQVDYVGTDTYAPQTATTMIIVNKASGKDMLFTLNPVTAKINDTISISATLTNINGTAINGGVVIFKVNGRTLRDNDGNIIYAKVVDGVAMIDNFIVPKGWAKSSITFTAKYGGNNEYSSIMTNATMNITKSVAKVEITSNTNVVAGKPATFSVKVTSDDKPVNGGTVIFKINGKTLRDTDGNIIQANVVDGVATINYTIPQNMAAKEYNFTCVFGNSLYERSDVNSTLTVVEENFI